MTPSNLPHNLQRPYWQDPKHLKSGDCVWILTDIEVILDIDNDEELPDGFDPDDDPSLPTPWWEPPADTKAAIIDLKAWRNDPDASNDLPF